MTQLLSKPYKLIHEWEDNSVRIIHDVYREYQLNSIRCKRQRETFHRLVQRTYTFEDFFQETLESYQLSVKNGWCSIDEWTNTHVTSIMPKLTPLYQLNMNKLIRMDKIDQLASSLQDKGIWHEQLSLKTIGLTNESQLQPLSVASIRPIALVGIDMRFLQRDLSQQ